MYRLELGAFETRIFAVQNDGPDRSLAGPVRPQRSGSMWANGRWQAGVSLISEHLPY